MAPLKRAFERLRVVLAALHARCRPGERIAGDYARSANHDEAAMIAPQPRVTRRWVGQWWLPDNPQRRVGGILEVDPTGRMRLELTDRLLDDDMAAAPAEIVLGTASGRPITLLRCALATGGSIVIAQFTTTTQVARPQVAMIGIELTDPTQSAFHCLEVTMTGLTAWAASTGLDRVYVASQDSNERTRLTVNWTEPMLATITDPLDATLGLHWTVKSSGPDVGNDSRLYQAEEHVALRVQTDTAQPWDAFGEPVIAVRDLVTVATQTPARITGRTLLITDGDAPLPYRVDLYYRGSGDATGEEPAFDRSDVIFTLGGDIGFAAIVERWLPLRKKIGLPLDVLLGLDYQREGYYENRLFNAASAAEGFHTALFPDETGLPENTHERLKQKLAGALKGLSVTDRAAVEDALASLGPVLRQPVSEMLQGVASDERQWVMNRVGDNRPGLKQRLEQLVTVVDAEAVSALLTDVDIWAKWLRDARNAIGHLNTGELRRRIPEAARYRLAYVTRALLHLVILGQLGIGAEVQRAVVRDAWGYSAERFAEAVNAARQRQPSGDA